MTQIEFIEKTMKERIIQLEARFSVEPSTLKSSAALLTYRPCGGRLDVWELCKVEWSEGAEAGMKRSTVREVPVRIQYAVGCPVAEFDMWRAVGCAVRDVSDLSLDFERFWEQYGYKVGNKARVYKKWMALPEGERLLALAVIPRYKRFAESKHIDRVYPETYIDQRRWENEF